MSNTKSLLATKLTIPCGIPTNLPHIASTIYVIRNSDGSVSTTGGLPVMCNGERLVLNEEEFIEMFAKAEDSISFKLEHKASTLDIGGLI